MSIIFIVNPVAGKGRSKLLVPKIQNICQSNKVSYEIKFTSKPNEATEIAKEYASKGVDRIIAVGGDGTLNEVINGIVGTQAAFGIIPGGSGNDFIRTLTQNKDIGDIIYGNIFGEVKPIDVAKCDKRYFINIASVGFDAEVLIETQNTKKLFSGSFAYFAALIKTIFMYRGKKIKLEIDDAPPIKEDTLLIAVANGRYYGGGILPAPRAKIQDGLFDVCFIRSISRIKMFILLKKFIKGKHEKIDKVSFHRGRKVKISCNERIAINIDGEIFLKNEIEFEIIPGGINAIFPSSI